MIALGGIITVGQTIPVVNSTIMIIALYAQCYYYLFVSAAEIRLMPEVTLILE